jgi:hypothetical protein
MHSDEFQTSFGTIYGFLYSLSVLNQPLIVDEFSFSDQVKCSSRTVSDIPKMSQS